MCVRSSFQGRDVIESARNGGSRVFVCALIGVASRADSGPHAARSP
jgi:hypothetical protein